jgi:hypothetical protein
MVFVYGTRFVGKVDHVPGKGYVVTQVFHLCNLPLVPLAGYVVREGTEAQTLVSGLVTFGGHRIPIRWASFAWGLGRAALWVLALLATMLLLPIWLGLRGPLFLVVGPLLGLALFAAHWLTRRPLAASPGRARAIAAELDRADDT